ncbi:Mov34/MPN/PAD-1 family protein [Methanomethylovorans sp.]|uniref:Mov34/MPN/PAD-1 family protein n=1 Tax=Methanomethylovorans sp. TaxID=2758717 RepID=UPI00351C4E6B
MKRIKGIDRGTLEFILEVSKSSYPNEFAGLLKAEDGIITEVLVLPGTESGETSALLKLFMMPNISTVGSVHSHPRGIIKPSTADLQMFGKTGNYHIIAGYPYDLQSWKCFNAEGDERDLQIIDG